MIDTMTMTKVVGGLCGTALIFLIGKWAAEEIYHVGAKGHGDHHELAYTIIDPAVDDAGAEEEEPEEVVDFATVLASADPSAGEGVFRACRTCHKVADGENGTGPHLYGIVGRATASVEGYNYSGKLIAVVDTWTADELNLFLENPRSYAPGTKMAYPGMKDVQDRADLIAWLDSLDE